MRFFTKISVIILLIIFSCRSEKISIQNISYLYDVSMQSYLPQCVAYHKNDSITTIYYTVKSESLMYVKELNSGKYTTNAILKLELFNTNDLKKQIDTAYTKIVDDDNQNLKELNGFIDIKTSGLENALLKITLYDINKHTSVDTYLNIYRQRDSRQHFLMLSSDSLPVYNNEASSNESFFIQTENKSIQKLWVRYYNRVFPIATPPYVESKISTFDFSPDSIFTVSVSNGKTDLLRFNQKGIYFFQTDTSSKYGYTVFRFDEDYPYITNVNQMMESIRYITEKKEYDEMWVQKDKKNAVDAFWLNIAGNEIRAKELIKKYYNRVQEANEYFTSFIEGWKTDKGLVYIVYGPPNIVYKSKNSEDWVYGEDRNMRSIRFTFFKMENPFTDNDYQLSRSNSYKDEWYIAVENWRR